MQKHTVKRTVDALKIVCPERFRELFVKLLTEQGYPFNSIIELNEGKLAERRADAAQILGVKDNAEFLRDG